MKRMRQKRRSQTRKRERRPASRVGPRQGREQQAQEAARRVLGGEQHVARRLSPVPAAAYHVPASRPEPLPGPLQIDLETGFGADLSAVRIHRDAAAAAAAGRERANAFAAGRHIFFNAGAFAPNTESGRELIAHEVAHVLQQTGRPASSGQIQVTDVAGTGEIQRAARQSPLESTQEMPSLSAIFKRHLADPLVEKFPDFKRVAEAIQADEVKAESVAQGPAFWKELARRVLAGEFDPGKEGSRVILRRLLYDLMKHTEQWTAAAHLLNAEHTSQQGDPSNFKTTFFAAKVYEQLDADFIDRRLIVIWQNDPFFQPYLPRRLYQTVYQYLLSATRDIPNLGVQEPLETAVEREMKKRDAPTGLIPNELVYVTIWAVERLDEKRRALLRDLAVSYAPDKVAKYGGNFAAHLTPGERQMMALGVEAEVPRWQEDATVTIGGKEQTSPEVSALLAHVAADVQTSAILAAEFWGAVQRLEAARVTGGKFDDAEAQVLIARFAKEEAFTTLHEHLAEKLDALMRVNEEGHPLSPGPYESARKEVRNQLRTDIYMLFEREQFALIERFWQGALTPEETMRMVLLGWIMLQLADLLEVLDEYSFKEDGEFVAQYNAPDIRISHRLHVARWVAAFSDLAGWETLRDDMRAIITATQPGIKENQVALLGDWERDTKVVISDLATTSKGFHPGVALQGFNTLTSLHLARLFQIEYFHQVNQMLETILAIEEGDLSVEREPIVDRVRAHMTTFRRPRRYHLRKYDLAVAPAGKGEDEGTLGTGKDKGKQGTGDERSRPYYLIMTHAKTQQKLKELGAVDDFHASNPLYISPVHGPALGSELFFWTIPPLKPLVERLQKIPELKRLVENYQPPPAPAPEAAAGETGSAEPEAAVASEAAEVDEKAESTPQPQTGEAGESIGPQPGWLEWLQKFIKVDLSTLTVAGTKRSLADWLQDQLGADVNEARVTMAALLRRAMAQDRQLLVKFKLRPPLEQYDKYDISTYSLPNEPLFLISNFAFAAEPRMDREAQQAAIILELFRSGSGKDLAPTFKEMERYDLIIGYQALFKQTVRFAQKNRSHLLLVLTEAEKQDTTWIGATVTRLEAIIKAMEEQKKKVQRRTGLVGIKGGGPEGKGEVASVASVGTIGTGPDHAFVIDGVSYQLVQVHENFRFHGGYGPRRSEAYTPPQLYIDGEPVATDENGNIQSTRLLLTIRIGTRKLPVYANNVSLLEQLTHAVGMAVIVNQLKDLGEFIEAAMEAMLELAEFIPGAGQVIMATRLATTVIGFIAGGDFAEIKEKLFVEPQEVFSQITDFFSGRFFTTDALLNFLLLGDTGLTDKLTMIRPRRAKPPASARRRGVVARFSKLIRRVQGLGGGLARSLLRVRGEAGEAFAALQVYVLARPTVNWLLAMIDNYYETLADVTTQFASVGFSKENVAEEFSSFSDHVAGLIEAINRIELPDELLPLEELLEITIDVVIDRLGKKYELAGRAILYVMEKLDLKQDLLEAVADQMRDAGLDPNVAWQKLVKEQLEPQLQTFRKDLIVGLDKVFVTVGMPALTGMPDVSVKTEAEEFPGAAGYPSEEVDEPELLNEGSRPLPAVSGGQPLPASLREDAEERFGHDFRHVRLHTGSDARQVTAYFRVEGLTTGSHIYLHPALVPDTGHGAGVLDHELAHVLQQTGPRPLGNSYDERPEVGQRRRGLYYDSAEEEEAEQIARRVAGGGGTGPVAVSAGRAAGAQPALTSGLLRKLLRRIRRADILQKQYERLDEAAGIAVEDKRMTPTIKGQIANIAQVLRGDIAEDRLFAFDKPFDTVRGDIATYFRGQTKSNTNFQQIVEAIARQALEPTGSPLKRRSKGKKEREWRLNLRRFRGGLEAYLFSQIGLATQLELNLTGSLVSGDRKINGRKPFNRVRVRFLYLPAVGATANLWMKAVDKTFGTNTPDERKVYQPRVRVYLAARGPVPGIWDRKKYQFSDQVKNDIIGQVTGTDVFPPDKLPPRGRYLSTSKNTQSEAGELPHIGLRLDIYEGKSQSAQDRESHHITQFLLLEYFRNWKSGKQPFKFDFALYKHGNAGLKADGATVGAYIYRSGTINMKELTGAEKAINKRGPYMPAISLARVTHRRGDVHIHGEPDEGEGGRPSPGAAVENRFKAGLANATVRDALFATKDQPLRELVATSGGRELVNEQIYTAMQSTYGWMRGEMLDRLQRGLRTVEVEYYNKLAAERPGGQDADHKVAPGDMSNIVKIARKHNDEVMGAAGWLSKE